MWSSLNWNSSRRIPWFRWGTILNTENIVRVFNGRWLGRGCALLGEDFTVWTCGVWVSSKLRILRLLRLSDSFRLFNFFISFYLFWFKHLNCWALIDYFKWELSRLLVLLDVDNPLCRGSVSELVFGKNIVNTADALQNQETRTYISPVEIRKVPTHKLFLVWMMPVKRVFEPLVLTFQLLTLSQVKRVPSAWHTRASWSRLTRSPWHALNHLASLRFF